MPLRTVVAPTKLTGNFRSQMWLLHTRTCRLAWFNGPWSSPPYAILSHLWSPNGEQTFRDVEVLRGFCGASRKIRACCTFARRQGYSWVWIDSCCINKESSAELSEAINSMYPWYADAHVCYAYLDDVSDDEDPRAPGSGFRRSRWFTRGWTLQELIAPMALVFLSREWRVVGTKSGLADVIEEVTGVESDVLMHRRPLEQISVARRMSWAAHRRTTRLEDAAYCMMGLFNVNMPTIYGEGRFAFVRLQEEILKHIPDQSIFAWGRAVDSFPSTPRTAVPLAVEDNSHVLFALFPREFADAGGVSTVSPASLQRRIGIPITVPDFRITSHGIRANLPLVPLRTHPSGVTHIAILACQDSRGHLLALLLRPRIDGTSEQFLVGHDRNGHTRSEEPCRILHLNHTRQWLCDGSELDWGPPQMAQIYISFNPPRPRERYTVLFQVLLERCSPPSLLACPCDVVLPNWVVAKLRAAGFAMVATPGDVRDWFVGPHPHQGFSIRFRCEDRSVLVRMRSCPVYACLCAYVDVDLRSKARRSGQNSEKFLGRRTRRLDLDMSPAGQKAACDSLCSGHHVRNWVNHSKEFRSRDVAVTLAFRSWGAMADSDHGHMYMLDIAMRRF